MLSRHILSLALVASLAACAAPPAPSPARGVVAQADTVILSGERGFAAAELAYITAADGVGHLVDQGVIRGPAAATARGWNAQAQALLIRGKAATNAAEKARDAAQLFDLADRIGALTRSK